MDVIQQMAAAGAVIALLSAVLWWLKRRGVARILPGRRSAPKKMECLERLPLAPQHTLHLVRLGDRALLVASTPGGCVLLESVPSGNLEPNSGERP